MLNKTKIKIPCKFNNKMSLRKCVKPKHKKQEVSIIFLSFVLPFTLKGKI